MTSGSVTNWIELFRTGDETAANHLWERYFSRLVSVARTKMVGMETQVEEAEDVALSAFHTLYRAARCNRLPDTPNRDSLWQLLLVITAGKIVDARRRAATQKRSGNGIVPQRDFASSLDVLSNLLSSEIDPGIAAIVDEEFARLMNLLVEMELQQIALLKLEGYTIVEICNRLNCSERTVKRRLAIIRRTWEESGAIQLN